MSVTRLNTTFLCLMLAALSISRCAGGEDVRSSGGLSLETQGSQSLLEVGKRQTAWIRVGLQPPATQRMKRRAAVNLAIVFDRSGSMQGQKLQFARDAAIGALNLLAPDDIVSVIAYDSDVNVIVPATKMTEREKIAQAIRGIEAGGNTALFAGLSKAAAEVRKFQDPRRINRIIVLSDGLANIGPTSPSELGALAMSLKKENISVSTLGLGLGYHEDVMLELASQSGGNHHFIEQEQNLRQYFLREFEDLLSVVALDVEVRVRVPQSLRLTRVLGNTAEIDNENTAFTTIAQMYGNQARSILMEVEIPAEFAQISADAPEAQIAAVEVTYRNMQTGEPERLNGEVLVGFSEDKAKLSQGVNAGVIADIVDLIGSEQNKLATQLLDQGDIEGCRAMLVKNREFLAWYARELECEKLEESARQNGRQLDALDGVKSNDAPAALLSRKGMRSYQFNTDAQLPPSGRQ
ncbi:MAG: VWA domain-containing protein [Planctomycetaceae bacterium]